MIQQQQSPPQDQSNGETQTDRSNMIQTTNSQEPYADSSKSQHLSSSLKPSFDPLSFIRNGVITIVQLDNEQKRKQDTEMTLKQSLITIGRLSTATYHVKQASQKEISRNQAQLNLEGSEWELKNVSKLIPAYIKACENKPYLLRQCQIIIKETKNEEIYALDIRQLDKNKGASYFLLNNVGFKKNIGFVNKEQKILKLGSREKISGFQSIQLAFIENNGQLQIELVHKDGWLPLVNLAEYPVTKGTIFKTKKLQFQIVDAIVG